MNWTLEVIVVPVSDVDRAKAFYADQVGFAVDSDIHVSDTVRFVQLTPRGSGCSIVLSEGMPLMAPGSLKGLQLVVRDVHAARAELVDRGVKVSNVQVFDGGIPRPARAEDSLDYAGFLFFDDPDGNSWAIQQISSRE